MSLEDIPARLQKRVDRLVNNAKVELKARGIDTTGKMPRQILMMARAATRRPRVPPQKKAT
jgi:hypothetical protein